MVEVLERAHLGLYVTVRVESTMSTAALDFKEKKSDPILNSQFKHSFLGRIVKLTFYKEFG